MAETETNKEFDFKDWFEEDGGLAGRASHYGIALAGGFLGSRVGKVFGNNQPLAKALGSIVGAVAMYKLGPELMDDIGDANKSTTQDIKDGKIEGGWNGLKERFSRIVANIKEKDGQIYETSSSIDADPDVT